MAALAARHLGLGVLRVTPLSLSVSLSLSLSLAQTLMDPPKWGPYPHMEGPDPQIPIVLKDQDLFGASG